MPNVTSCSTLGFADYTLEEAIRTIAWLGFKEVSIAHMSSYCTHYDYQNQNHDPSNVLELLSQHGLRATSMNQSVSRPCPAGAYQISRPEDAHEYRTHVRHLIDHASRLQLQD